MSRVFSYFLKIFFHASPTYASFSPLFVRFFATSPPFPQLLVLSFPQHHNRCSRLSPIGSCKHTISVPILFADRKSVFQELTFCGESRPTSPNLYDRQPHRGLLIRAKFSTQRINAPPGIVHHNVESLGSSSKRALETASPFAHTSATQSRPSQPAPQRALWQGNAKAQSLVQR